MNTYTVLSGDTIYGISKQFGIPISEIKSLNNLDSNELVIGEKLNIPKSDNTMEYIVKENDNLYNIASKYNISVDELKQFNNLSSNNLDIGQIIYIPSSSNSNLDYINYKVRRGDNLYIIANKYNTSVNDIKNINSLTTNNLGIGQIIKIPISTSIPINTNYYITYIVRRGDSLYSIANKYDMTVDELKSLNNLNSNSLNIGQELLVKNNEYDNTEIKECYGDNYVEATYKTYTVKKGDNLYEIAKKFNTTVDNLKKLNNLNSNNLDIGQILKIEEE